MSRSKNSINSFSAYEKAAKDGIDSRCVPLKLIGPVPEDKEIEYPEYSKSDIGTWKLLYLRQMKHLPGKACDEYLHGVKQLKLSSEKIPSLRELSAVLKRTTGWTVARVPGLIDVEDFFAFLKRKVFPSTDYIRGKDELDYTPAPDMFHDIFGHMPLLTDPHFALFYQKFGEAALHATSKDRKYLETFHWFTVEFGLIKKKEGIRLYGAGIISSLSEVQHALSNNVSVIPFDPEKIVSQEYDVWHLQPVLFAIDSFEQLEKGFFSWTKKKKLL